MSIPETAEAAYRPVTARALMPRAPSVALPHCPTPAADSRLACAPWAAERCLAYRCNEHAARALATAHPGGS